MKKYSSEVLHQIREFRKEGLTYPEINTKLRLSIPKSTLSYICKNVDPGYNYRERIAQESKQRLIYIRELATKKNRQLFDQKLASMKSDLGYVTGLMHDKHIAKIALAMLYLGEGSKWKSRRGPSLCSSDPRIISTYLNLLYACYGVEKHTIRCRIQHRADQDHDQLLIYWQKVTGLPRTQFYDGYLDKRTIGKPTKKAGYMGVCSITNPGTYIQLELDMIADIISGIWGIGAVG